VDGAYASNETGTMAVPVSPAFGSILRRQVVEMKVDVPQRLRQRLEDINRIFGGICANWLRIGALGPGKELRAPVSPLM
jgi:hypothetical protein